MLRSFDPDELRAVKTISPLRLLVVPFAAWLALPGCRDKTGASMDPEWLRLEADRVKLAHEVELAKLRLSKVENRDGERAGLSARLDREVERHALLLEKAEILRDEVAELDVRLAGEREELLRSLRAAAAGRSFERLEGSRGRVFEDVVITRVTEVGIEFRHATGSARLAAADLTDSQQGQFGLDPGVAGEALEEEQAIARAYGNWVDGRVAVAKAEEKEAEAARLAAEAARPKVQPVVAAAAPARTRLRDEPRNVGRQTVWYPSYYPRYRYSYYRSGYNPCYTPSPCVVPLIPGIRAASGSWSFSTRSSGCHPTPVITRRPSSSFSFP